MNIKLSFILAPNPTPTHEYAGLVKYMNTSVVSAVSFAMLSENWVSVFET